jgi:uncharacterized membrane protein
MRVDRSRDRPVRYLEWRARLLGIGAVVALAGMMLEKAWMVNGAIGILLVTLALRFIGRAERDENLEDLEDDEGSPQG